MSSRDDILASIRTNLPSLDRPLPYVPLFDDHAPTLQLNTFKVNLHRMGGVFLDAPIVGDVLAPARAKPTGRPPRVATRCSRSPQKYREWQAQ